MDTLKGLQNPWGSLEHILRIAGLIKIKKQTVFIQTLTFEYT